MYRGNNSKEVRIRKFKSGDFSIDQIVLTF